MTTNVLFLGIDLGTTHSSLAYVVDDPRHRSNSMLDVGVIEMPVDEQQTTKSRRMPSIVAKQLDDGRVRRPLVGWQFFRDFTRRRRSAPLLRNGRNFFASVKSDMGTHRSYPHAFSTDFNTLVKVSARILASLLEAAAADLGGALRDARVVITVPASFSALAREDTLRAAELAGLNPEHVELIDEPIAALLDLLNDQRASRHFTSEQPRQLLVFDYGGGTCDLALVRVRYDASADTGLHVENLAISEYRQLGGDDIDRAIMSKVLWAQIGDPDAFSATERRQIEDTLTPTVARNLKENLCRRVTEQLRLGPHAWEALSAHPFTVYAPVNRISSPTEHGVSTPNRFKMTTADFEKIMEPFLEVPEVDLGLMSTVYPDSLLVPILQIVNKAGLSFDALDILALHGGGCRNPYVQRHVTEKLSRMDDLFGAMEIVQTPDLDASVARGAALACYWKHVRGVELVRPIMAEDVGVVALNDVPACLVPAGTPLPYPDEDGVATAQQEFYVSRDGQPEMLVPLYTRTPTRIAGSVQVPLPSGVPQGAAVRIKLSVDRSKRLRWWFSIQGGPFAEAPAINDPWTNEIPSPDDQPLLAHRRSMREALESGRQLSPDSEYQEAALLFRAHREQEALVATDEYLDAYKDSAKAFNLKGLILGNLKDYAQAADCHRRAAEIDPSEPAYRGNYGCELFRVGKPQHAIAALRAALSLEPRHIYLYEWLGDIYRHVSDEDRAQTEYRQGLLLATSEKNTSAVRREAWETRARLHYKLGEYDQADDARRQATKILRDARYGGDSDNMITSL